MPRSSPPPISQRIKRSSQPAHKPGDVDHYCDHRDGEDGGQGGDDYHHRHIINNNNHGDYQPRHIISFSMKRMQRWWRKLY